MIKNLNKHQQILIFTCGNKSAKSQTAVFCAAKYRRRLNAESPLQKLLYRENSTKERESSFYFDHNSLSAWCITAYQNKQEGLRGTKTTPRLIEAFSCDKRKLESFYFKRKSFWTVIKREASAKADDVLASCQLHWFVPLNNKFAVHLTFRKVPVSESLLRKDFYEVIKQTETSEVIRQIRLTIKVNLLETFKK